MVVITVYTGELMTAPQVSCTESYQYAYCDDIDGCGDLTSDPDKNDPIVVCVKVPVTALMDYIATFMVCTNGACFTTTTLLGE